jgi:hypothetical protein
VEEDGANLLRLVAALAALRRGPDKFDYVILDEDSIRGLGITIKKTDGDSADPAANANWHRDLVELTWDKLIALIRMIQSEGEFCRVLERRVGELVGEGVRSGVLDRSRVNEKFR